MPRTPTEFDGTKSKTKPTLASFKKSLEGWNFYIDESVFATSPEPEGTLELFNVGKYITDDDLEKEYASRGLVPAGVHVLAAYMSVNPDFKEEVVGTHWKDENGNWCFEAFFRWDSGRFVFVRRYGDAYYWRAYWWFGGLRKPSALEPENSSDTLPLELRVQKLEEIIKHHNLGL